MPSVLKWLQGGELCRNCGSCCMDVSSAPLTVEDAKRISKGIDVPLEEVFRVMGSTKDSDGNESHEIYLRVSEKTGACPALSSINGQYACNIYEHRPEACRKYKCFIYSDAEEWHHAQERGRSVVEANMFYTCRNANEVIMEAYRSISSLRSSFRWEYSGPYWTGKKPSYYPALQRALGGMSFQCEVSCGSSKEARKRKP